MISKITKTFIFITFFIIGSIFLTSFSVKVKIFSINDLSPIEIKGNYISPKDGISLSEAKKLIVNHLEKNGVKGDIFSSAQVKEITIKEAWENIGIQLYSVNVDYAWLDGIAIIKNSEVLTVLSGMSTLNVFLADLDKDGIYEIYTNIEFGSGIIDKRILGYNVVFKEIYNLSNRQKQDFNLFIENDTLMVKVHTFTTKATENKKVILKKVDGRFELNVE